MMRHEFTERYTDDIGEPRYRCWRCGIARHWDGGGLHCNGVGLAQPSEEEIPLTLTDRTHALLTQDDAGAWSLSHHDGRESPAEIASERIIGGVRWLRLLVNGRDVHARVRRQKRGKR